MGSLSSMPVAPQPQIVYVPATPSVSGSTSDTSTGGGTTSDNGTSASEERQKNLLQRNRGRLGTILSGFRGVLSPSNTSSSRKTLLGE